MFALSVLAVGGVAVGCGGGDDDSTPGSGGSAGHTAGRGGTAGSGGTKSSAGSGGTTSSGGSGGTTSSGGSGGSSGTTSSGGSSTSAGRGGTGGRGGAQGVGGSNAQGGAGESSAGEGGAGPVDTSCLSSPAGAAGDGAGGEGGGPSVPPDAKTPLAGLVDMQIISWHNTDDGVPTFLIDDLTAFPGVFGGVVINAAWNMLQPTECGPIETKYIDDALAQVRAYNDDNPTAPVGVKLRVYGGSTAPDWAKNIDGGPVPIQRNDNGCNTTDCTVHVGKYWTPEYVNAWRAFQKQLAARYDDEPLIHQIAVTSCASQTDEPFVPTTDQASKDNLSGAGYTDQAGKDCLSGAVEDYSAWKRTLVDFTFNPFNNLAGGVADSAFTISVMDACRAKLGSRCVIANHALAWPLDASTPVQAVYDEIQKLEAPITFQTQSPEVMDCQWTGTLALGVSLGAGAVEVWPKASLDGFLSLSADNVAALAAEFTSPIPVPTGSPAGGCPDFN